jgi:coenzyme F420-dependent glucose-6-phosphate dehydrogenase
MDEALGMIRRLWQGETLDGKGRHFATKQAKLHTLPKSPPPVYVSAFHEKAAKVAAKHGDGIWSLGDPESVPKLLEAYRDAGGTGEVVLQAMASYAETDDAALEAARVWKGAQPDEYYVDDWHDPKAMYEHAEQTVSDDAFKESAILSADPEVHVEKLKEIAGLGATTLAVMNCSGTDPKGMIRMYGEHVLPALHDL